jgi:hypothetical protein
LKRKNQRKELFKSIKRICKKKKETKNNNKHSFLQQQHHYQALNGVKKRLISMQPCFFRVEI